MLRLLTCSTAQWSCWYIYDLGDPSVMLGELTPVGLWSAAIWPCKTLVSDKHRNPVWQCPDLSRYLETVSGS